MNTSSRACPTVYAAGATLNPALRGDFPPMRLTTKPDCFNLFSRLQSAHRPVCGQGFACAEEGSALEAVVACAGRWGPDPESADRDEPRPHAPTPAHRK